MLRTILKHFKGSHLAQKKFKFHAWVKKCNFVNFCRNRLIGWIGHALLVQPTKTAYRIFFLFYILIFFKYETIVRISASSFGHSNPDPSSVRKEFCPLTLISYQPTSISLVIEFLIWGLKIRF